MSDGKVSITFDKSAISFVAETFHYKVVDDKLMIPDLNELHQARCAVCQQEIHKDNVGGFFKSKTPRPDVCCSSDACLGVMLDD